jgi:predicted methyltransferase
VLESLGLEPVNCYLRLIMAFNGEIRRLSLDLRRMAGLNEDVRLLMTIPGIGYYTALLVKLRLATLTVSVMVSTTAVS